LEYNTDVYGQFQWLIREWLIVT